MAHPARVLCTVCTVNIMDCSDLTLIGSKRFYRIPFTEPVSPVYFSSPTEYSVRSKEIAFGEILAYRADRVHCEYR